MVDNSTFEILKPDVFPLVDSFLTRVALILQSMSESITNVAAATNFDKDNSWKYFSTFNSIFQLDSINDFFPFYL